MTTDNFKTRIFCDKMSTNIRSLLLFVVGFFVFAVLAKLLFTKLIAEGMLSEDSGHEYIIYVLGFMYLIMAIITVFWPPKIIIDHQGIKVSGNPQTFFFTNKKKWVDMSEKDIRKLTRKTWLTSDLIEIERLRSGRKKKSSITDGTYINLIKAYRENALKMTPNETGLTS